MPPETKEKKPSGDPLIDSFDGADEDEKDTTPYEPGEIPTAAAGKGSAPALRADQDEPIEYDNDDDDEASSLIDDLAKDREPEDDEPDPQEDDQYADQGADDEAESPEGAPPPRQINEELLSRAKKYGMEENEIKQFGSPEALEAAMNVMARKLGTVEPKKPAEQSKDDTAEAETPPAKSDTPPAKKPKDAAQDTDEGFSPNWGEDADEIDPDLRGVVDRLVTHVNEQIKTIKAELGIQHARMTRTENVQMTRRLDKFVATLPEDVQAVVGKTHRDRPPDSPQDKALRALASRAVEIGKGRVAVGDEQFDYDDLLRGAAQQLYPDSMVRHGTRQIVANAKRRAKTSTKPPTRTKKSTTGDETKDAEQAVAEMLAEMEAMP